MAANGSKGGGAQLFEAACDLERVAVIFNPASGTQDTGRRRAALEALARAAGLHCELGGTDGEQGAAALAGEVRPVDVGRANGKVFLIMAGMGLDAHMVRDADREMKERLGVLAYLWAILRNLGRNDVRYAITIDGRLFHRRAKTVLVANLGRITGGLELVPGADPEDGLLEVAILRAQGLWDLVILAAGALF